MIVNVHHLNVVCEFKVPAAILKTPFAVRDRTGSEFAALPNRKKGCPAEIALDLVVVDIADPEFPVAVAELAAEIVPAAVAPSRHNQSQAG
ncbi:MAG: hypothetical protein ACYC43_05665 [Burkholderiales bacterium]